MTSYCYRETRNGARGAACSLFADPSEHRRLDQADRGDQDHAGIVKVKRFAFEMP